MSFLKRIFSLFNSSAGSQQKDDSNVNIIKQIETQLAKSENEINRAKQSVAKLVANEIIVKRDINKLKSTIKDHEAYAVEAVYRNDEPQALQIAEKIIEYKEKLNSQSQYLKTLSQESERLQKLIETSSKSIANMKQQLLIVQSTESAQKVATTMSSSGSNDMAVLSNAKSSLEYVQSYQKELDAQREAADEVEKAFGDDALKAKLIKDGVIPSNKGENSQAKEVLETLKTK